MPITSTADFEALYDATVTDLLAYVRRRAHPLVVEEVVSETYLVARRRRADVPDDARPWLFVVARNTLLAAGRGERRQQDLPVRLAPESTDRRATDPAAGVAERLALRDAWSTLSPGEQEVLGMRLLDDLDARTAARVLGCSRAAYAMRLTRARRSLERALRSFDTDTDTHRPAAAHPAR